MRPDLGLILINRKQKQNKTEQQDEVWCIQETAKGIPEHIWATVLRTKVKQITADEIPLSCLTRLRGLESNHGSIILYSGTHCADPKDAVRERAWEAGWVEYRQKGMGCAWELQQQEEQVQSGGAKRSANADGDGEAKIQQALLTLGLSTIRAVISFSETN